MIGLVAVTAAGRAAAASLMAAWPAEVHLNPLSNGSDALKDAWQNYDAVVSFLNVGATVRILAPLLGDKTTDPAVVCVDEAREFAVAVLGGHHGANTLARRVSEVLGCRPVITTASDQANLPALDSFGADLGFTVQNPELLARLGAAVLSGDPVRLENPGRWPIPPLPENVVATDPAPPGLGDEAVVAASGVVGLSDGRLPAKVGPPGSGLFGIDDGSVVDPVSFERSERVGPPGSGLLGIEDEAGGDPADVARSEGGSASGPRGSLTIRISDAAAVPEDALVYRPKSLVVGVGSARGVDAEEVSALVDEALAGYSPLSVRALATIDVKADEVGILEVARHRGWEVLTYPAEILDRISVPNPSAIVRAEVGTGSVAEAAALAASESLGTKGFLVCEKRKSAGATVAVARLTPRGRLSIVGLGPGARDLVTPRAVASLRRAAVIVGLDQYVDQVRDLLAPGTRIVASGLGQEEERARRAVAEAAAGRAVALVGSGDAGVYAMASPALEFAGRDIDVDGVPGITAAVAASALLGAPLGHDHAYISLSDLHTPWEIIERRVRAAAEGDFTVCFYNPRSRQRDWQLPESLKILGGGRPPETPVGLVRNAARADQTVTITTLGELDVTMVDMFTVVIVGSSRSRTIHGRFVTPRGYRWSGSS
jgi:cobalt-precorrin 5A hydrolase / precorrin-3B C17-methyltransferase